MTDMSKRKVILDTDPGVDDVLAILMALASPEIDVTLISIVFGNTHAPVAHANLLKIYHMLAQEIAAIPTTAARYQRLQGQEKTILAMGENAPIDGDKAVAAYFHGVDGLSNISETHPHFTPPDRIEGDIHEHLEITSTPAPQKILDILRSEPPQTVTIVALGPLTNLAHAYQADPTTFQRVHTFVWMGGTLDHPGNTSPVAEFNCFADPYAARMILDACKQGAFPLIMAPLDITTPHQIPFADLIHPSFVKPFRDPQDLPSPASPASNPSNATIPPSPLRSFISAMLLRVRGLHASFGLPDAMEMHDPVAVWFALSHAGLPPLVLAEKWQLRPRDFKVERIGEYTRGMCVVDRRGTGEANEDRSKSSRLQNNNVPVPSLPPKDDTKGRMGETIVKSVKLPLVIVGTPGKEELRRLVLGRVLGDEV